MPSTWLEADHDIIGVDVSHWQVGPNISEVLANNKFTISSASITGVTVITLDEGLYDSRTLGEALIAKLNAAAISWTSGSAIVWTGTGFDRNINRIIFKYVTNAPSGTPIIKINNVYTSGSKTYNTKKIFGFKSDIVDIPYATKTTVSDKPTDFVILPVDWAWMAQMHPNLGFAMCKASQKTADEKLKTNLPAMKQHLSTVTRTFGNYTHPIAIGTYHFSNINHGPPPSNKESVYVAQADMYFKEVIETNVVPNFWVLDWEDEKGDVIPGTKSEKETFRAKMAKVFVIRLYNNLKKAFGSSYVPKIFIYLGLPFWGSPATDGNPYEWFGSYGPKLWIARYIDVPNTPPEQYHYDYAKLDPRLNISNFEHDGHQWHAWQFTQTANIHGVGGKCDLSVARNSDVWHNDFYQSGPEPQSWPPAVSNPNFFNY